MKQFFAFFILVVSLTNCDSTTTSTENNVAQDEPSGSTFVEAAAVNQAVLDAYQSLHFTEGNDPDYEAIRRIFMEDAVFISFRGDSLDKVNLNEFIAGFQDAVLSGQVRSFQEAELFGRTEGFGKIAHRISTYGTYVNHPDSLVERGINSFQLVKLEEGWKVHSVIWDVEKKGQPIPEWYLE